MMRRIRLDGIYWDILDILYILDILDKVYILDILDKVGYIGIYWIKCDILGGMKWDKVNK